MLHPSVLFMAENRLYTPYSLTVSDGKELIAQLASVEDETEIIKECDKYACKRHSYHRKNNLKNKEANCVGYAQYTTALLNFAFKYKGLCQKLVQLWVKFIYMVSIPPVGYDNYAR